MTGNTDKLFRDLKENLRLIEERCAQYVEEIDIPLQYIRERDRLRQQIAHLELEREVVDGRDIIEKANVYLVSIDGLVRRLMQSGWDEGAINELDDLTTSIEVDKEAFGEGLTNESLTEDIQRRRQSLLLLLRRTNRAIERYEQIADYLETHPVSSTIVSSIIPHPQNFVDRDDVLDRMKNAFESYGIMVIAGVGGVGKTYLVQCFVTTVEDCRKIWIVCTPELTMEQFFFSIDEILAKDHGDFCISDILRNKRRLTESKVANILLALDRSRLCIVIDDFHTANDELELLVELFGKYAKKVKLIILTRRRSKSLRDLFYLTYEEDLVGIDIGSVAGYLEKYRLQIKPELCKPIYEKTAGHPLALRMFASLCVVERYEPEALLSEFEDAFGNKLEAELISKVSEGLDPHEKELLSRFSVFRVPVKREVIKHIYDGNDLQTVLNSLLHRFLITEPVEKEFSTHDLIKEFFYAQLADKVTIHRHVAQYYLDSSTMTESLDDDLEAYYHFYRASDYTEAAQIAIKAIEKLEIEASFELILGLIEQLDMVLGKLPAKLLISKAKVLEIWGRWDKAISILSDVLDHPGLEPEDLLATLNTSLLIYDQRGEYEQGMSLFKRFETVIAADNYSSELAHLYHRVGRFYHEWNNYEKTLEYYEKSLTISTFLKDRKNIIRTKRLLGVVSWFFGYYDEALIQLQECLALCREERNQRELQRFAEVLIPSIKIESVFSVEEVYRTKNI